MSYTQDKLKGGHKKVQSNIKAIINSNTGVWVVKTNKLKSK